MRAWRNAVVAAVVLTLTLGLAVCGCSGKKSGAPAPEKKEASGEKAPSTAEVAEAAETPAPLEKEVPAEDPEVTAAVKIDTPTAQLVKKVAEGDTEWKEAETTAKTPAAEVAKPAKPGRPSPATVHKTDTPPTIDGKLDDACWKDAQVPGTWVDVYTGDAPKIQPKAFICYDDKFVYVAFLNPEPQMKNVVADCTDRDGQVWTDDANELFLDPTAGRQDYYQFIVNSAGVLYDGQGRDGAWDAKVTVKAHKGEDAWSVELAIPLADMGVKLPLKGQTWTANFCRDRMVTGEALAHAWADTGESFHNSEAFGKLKID